MQGKSFVAGLAIGLVFAGGVFVAKMRDDKIATGDDRKWVLPGFQYTEYPNDDPQGIYVSGTLLGDEVGYPVNTWDLKCYRDERICRSAEAEEIGRDQLGTISTDDWPIVTWTNHTVIAQTDPSDTTSCARATITINRDAKTVSYTTVPQNEDKDYCKRLHHPKTYEWHIGTAPRPWEKPTTL